jgi:hypothetical protein
MKIIASHNLPIQAVSKLSELGKVILLDDQPNIYQSIASHPDIFFCQLHDQLVVAPTLPNHIKNQLHNIDMVQGESIPAGKYPSTASYNATATKGVFIHNLHITDPSLLKITEGLHQIHVNQAYTRCSLLALDDEHFIASDRGIENKLLQEKKKVLHIEPDQVVLAGQQHGFFGGACGISGKSIFICGSLKFLPDADAFTSYIGALGYNYMELYNGPILDVGSILFLMSKA